MGVTQTDKVTEDPGSRPNGHVFTERGVYKPGETVHFKFVSRIYKDKRIVPPAGEKVNIEITGPTKDVNYSKDLKLNEFGSCWDSLQTKAFYPVGTYTIRVKAKKTERRGPDLHQHLSGAGIQKDSTLRQDLRQERREGDQRICGAETH